MLILITKLVGHSHTKAFSNNGRRKVFFRIFNFIMVDGNVAWNMSAKMKGIFKDIIVNLNLRVYVANLMLN